MTERMTVQRAKPSLLAGEGGERRESGEGASLALAKARAMRHVATDAEKKLWSILRNRQCAGAKFKRQVPIGPYIADFICFEARIIVEVDGGQHADSLSDQTRDNWFTDNGYLVRRFWNNEVLKSSDGVFDVLCTTVKQRLSRTASAMEQ